MIKKILRSCNITMPGILLFCYLLIFSFFYNKSISKNNIWFPDNARDYLVAKNIVEYHEYMWIAPFAENSNNLLVNSGLYYYFVSVLYFFSFGNGELYFLLFTLVSSVTILIFSFKIGELLFEKKILHYLTAIFMYTTPILFVFHKFVYQPNFLLPILLIALYFFLLSHKQLNNKSLAVANVFYMISLHIHLSSLVLLPWVVYETLTLTKKMKGEKKNPTIQLVIFFIGIGLLILNQLLLKRVSHEPISFFKFIETNLNHGSFLLQNFLKNAKIFLGKIPFLYILIVLPTVFTQRNKKTASVTIKLFFALSLVVLLLWFLTGVKEHQFFYFFPGYIIVQFTILSLITRYGFKIQTLLMSALIITNVYAISDELKYTFNPTDYHSYNQYAKSTKVILNDLSKLPKRQSFFLYVIDNVVNFSSPVYYLYLQNETGVQYVENGSYERFNILPKTKQSNLLYLICDDPRVEGESLENSTKCIERFENRLISYEKIFEDTNQNHTIYRVYLRQYIKREETL